MLSLSLLPPLLLLRLLLLFWWRRWRRRRAATFSSPIGRASVFPSTSCVSCIFPLLTMLRSGVEISDSLCTSTVMVFPGRLKSASLLNNLFDTGMLFGARTDAGKISSTNLPICNGFGLV